MDSWQSTYHDRDDLAEYGSNGLGLFALSLRFGLDDLESIASDCIVDGSGDKKLDMVYIDLEGEYAVIAQCYYSNINKKSAKANKASDLNTGLAWLLGRNIDEVPDRIKSAARDLRKGVEDKKIKNIYIWYVHNLPESDSVNDEMVSVQETAESIIQTKFTSNKTKIHNLEIGKNTFDRWYRESLTPILVNKDFEIDINGGYLIEKDNWRACSTTIPARFLHRIYKKDKNDIFSANVREYLGARSSSSNVNNGIRNTVINGNYSAPSKGRLS